MRRHRLFHTNIALAAAAALSAGTAAGDGGSPFPFCQVVDRAPDAVSGVEWGFTASKGVEGGGTFGLAGTRGWAEFAYFRTGRGDVALSAEARLDIPMGRGLEMPDGLLAMALRARWDVRGYNGLTVRLEAEPGLYAATAAPGRGLDVPLSATAIQSFTDRFSGFAGLALRPRDDRVVDPVLGLRYSPVDALVLDVGYPSSRALWRISRYGSLAVGAELDRRHEYALPDGDERGRVRYRESRYFGAVGIALADAWTLDLRAGLAAGRELGFEDGPDRGYRRLRGGFFMNFGISGSF